MSEFAASSHRPSVRVREDDLTVLYNPPSEAILADIIFVHGLQGHARRTREFKGDSSNKPGFLGLLSRKRKVEEINQDSPSLFWPEALLPDDYQNLRVLTYGYDSHVSHYFKGPASKLNLSQLAEGLLNRVAGERERSNCADRPIVFVAHSLGGLLVKEALVESKKQLNDSFKAAVYKCTQAIIFFGTPHRGTDDAKWGLILSTIASAAFDTNNKIVRVLEPDSEVLDKLARDFQDIIDDGRLNICSLLESVGKTGLPIFNGKVVPDASASIGSRQYEHRDYINKNHMNMCRFASKEDGGYNRFKDGLSFCLKAVEALVERRCEDLLNSLKFPNMASREVALVDAKSNTLEWLWSIPTGPESFTEWLSTKKGIFFIQGKPGSGKSTIMKYLRSHALTRSYLDMANKKAWVVVRFFFDFRAKKSTSNNIEGFLRSMIRQMILELPSLVPYITRYGKESTVEEDMDEIFCWDLGRLRKALISGLEKCSKNVCVLVDGLDEFDSSGSEMLDLLSFFKDIDNLDDSSHRIKVCLASRPESLIIEFLGKCCGFKVQDYNKLGIHEHLSSRLELAAVSLVGGILDHNPIMELAQTITERARGVFLWARFAIDELIEGIAEGDDVDQLKTRLEGLPDDIQDIYARILSRINQKSQDMRETAIMLQIGSFTLRSLPLKEFVVVFSHSLGKPVPQACLADKFFLESFKKRILAKTGGLLEVLNTTDKQVMLIHETVLAYLNGLAGLFKVGIDSDVSAHSSYRLKALADFVPFRRRPSTLTPFTTNRGANTPPTEGPLLAVANSLKISHLTKGQMRRDNPCIRCRTLRIRCHSNKTDLLGPCDTCKNPTLKSFLCFRGKITECILYQTSSSIPYWTDFLLMDQCDGCHDRGVSCDTSSLHRVDGSQRYAEYPLLLLQQFQFEGSLISEPSLDLSRSCGIAKFEQARKALIEGVDMRVESYVAILSDERSYLALRVFQAAIKMAGRDYKHQLVIAEKNHTETLWDCIQIWTAVRCMENGWHLRKEQSRDVSDDPSRGFCMTPIIHYQLEAIIQDLVIAPRRTRVLANLQRLMMGRKGRDFMICFLTTFILLHNYDMILKHQKTLARDRRTQDTDLEHIGTVNSGAATLLTFFHYSYNGLSLFDSERKLDEHPLFADLDALEIELIEFIRANVPEEDKTMDSFASFKDYPRTSWFTDQLFVKNWKPPASMEENVARQQLSYVTYDD